MIKINTNHAQLAALREYVKSQEANPHFNRIYAELRFLCALSDSTGGRYDPLLRDAAAGLAADIAGEGSVRAAAVQKTENMLSALEIEAKSYEFLCVAHAHIDMNWMWGYHETVALTLATMKTMLDMMEEFPAFTFSQSQASVYRIVEEFAPELFARIKKRVNEGRWEILASTWVEADKNMPSGESLTRHILHTKQYISETFGIDKDDLVIDFEPDTFGHSRNVPEICNSGGVRYYYHCRGQVGEHILYRWRAPSGSELIVYTEPFWYNADMDSLTAEYAPELARISGGKTLLKVYGVGDHGGGPARRDITRIIEMDSWPLYPRFTFGRLRDYFNSVALRRESLPLLTSEINFVCDGCYTTQSRIKAGNRKSERLLKEAELYGSAATLYTGREYPAGQLNEAWRKTLFNQFHDIIPGSGVTETREYASGLYQQVFAAAESIRTLALGAIADRINTAPLFRRPSALPEDTASESKAIAESRGEGAGVGRGQTGRSAGKERVYHLFNPLPFDRRGLSAITIWDYEGDFSQVIARGDTGKPLPVQAGESGDYWGHHFDTLWVDASVPACGYTSVVIDEQPDYTPRTSFINDMRIQSPDAFVLENEHIKVSLKPGDGGIASFIDKKSGNDLASQGEFGIFRLAWESVHKNITDWNGGMSAWFTGTFKRIIPLDGFEIVPVCRGALRNAYKLSASFGQASSLQITVSLEAGSKRLCYEVICDWREFGSDQNGVPNLHFYLRLPCKSTYRFDVPFGITERPPVDMDMPAESFVLAENTGVSLALLSRDKYAFRCLDKSMSLTLIRGAYDPDLTPETGRHEIAFAITPIESASDCNAPPVQESLDYRHPFTVISGVRHTGDIAPSGSLIRLNSGSVSLSAVKRSETGGNRLLFRVFETDGKDTIAEFTLGFRVQAAYLTDANEEKRLGTCSLSEDGKSFSFAVPAYGVRAVILEYIR
jgi:alpha-mannosidase